MGKFNNLHVPEHWEQYWSKYPNGYSIMEALIDWVSQVDEMVNNVNDWNLYLDDFVSTFDEKLQETVILIIQGWIDEGFLGEVVRQAINDEVIQARVNFQGIVYDNLKLRLDSTDTAIQMVDDKVLEASIDSNGIVYSSLKERLIAIDNLRTANKLFTVGPEGTHTDLVSAIKSATTLTKTYEKNTIFEIKILTGYIMTQQIVCNSIDLSNIIISSEASEVIIDGTSFSYEIGDEFDKPIFVGLKGAYLPIINTLFRLSKTALGYFHTGIYLETSSSAIVTMGSGIKNPTGYGIRASDNSKVTARGSIFTGAGLRGAMISQGSTMNAPFIDLSFAKGRNTFRAYRNASASLEGSNLSNGQGDSNVRISESSHVDLQFSDISNNALGINLQVFGASTVYASGCDLTNAGTTAVEVSNGSSVSVDKGANLSNAGSRGIDCYTGSTVTADDSIINSTSGEAIRVSSSGVVSFGSGIVTDCLSGFSLLAELGGIIHASSAKVSGGSNSFVARNGGSIIGGSMKADGSVIGFNAYNQGNINAPSASAINCSSKGVQASTGSTVNVTNGTFTGAGTNGIHAYRGSDIKAYGSNCRKGSIDSDSDIVCTTGSTLVAVSSIGGTNMLVNTLTGEGIIYR